MVPDSLIRRLRAFAQRHLWDGVCAILFAGTLIAGLGSVSSGAGKFAASLVPGTAAQASDEMGHSHGGVARLPLFAFAGASAYAPQVLFPVISHAFPAWLTAHGPFTPPPP